jgi:hypothetical protein
MVSSMYLLIKRNKNNEMIAGVAFAPMRVNLTLVCYIKVTIAREDHRRQ